MIVFIIDGGELINKYTTVVLVGVCFSYEEDGVGPQEILDLSGRL